MVHYEYDSASGKVERTEDGRTRSLGGAKVSEFKVDMDGPENNQLLKIQIKVDAEKEKDEKVRSDTSKGNVVVLKAMLFPKFFKNFAVPEEKFWNNARNVK